MQFVLRAGACGLFAMLLVIGHAGAQEDDPAATPISPAECTVEPLGEEALIALFKATPGVMRATLDRKPVATPMPPTGGIPADAETVALVTATARELVACANAGDLVRIFALFSDRYLYAMYGGLPGPDVTSTEISAKLHEFATPVPPQGGSPLILVALEDVRVLPDGRVLATLVYQHDRVLASFVKVDDRYLADWAYVLPDDGTPAP